MILPFLTIVESPLGGRGVFATDNISTDTTIEISPVLVLSPSERVDVEKTELYNYVFEWGDDLKSCAVAFGYVSMYNHSYHANCTYITDFETNEIRIKTVKEIKAGDELTINYNNEADDETPIWFDAK